MSMVEIHHTTTQDPTATHLRAVLGDRDLACLELRWPGRANGHASAGDRRLEIRRLSVGSGVHGRGVIGRLFDRLLVLARERGIRGIDIVVHHAAIGLCQEIGFRVTGEGFWDGSRRFVPMTLDLTASSGSPGLASAGHAIARLARSRLLEGPPTETEGLQAIA